jgi:acylphosphatase
MISAANIRITGRVQGVWYRAGANEQAQALGLVGWVRNMPDGSVQGYAEGAKDKIEALVAWCKKGPQLAHVENVDVEWVEPQGGFDSFGTTY